jgi:hypothetical protein
VITALLLASQLTTADATDVGRNNKFGLGLTVGLPSAVTGKYWLNEKSGITGYVGTSVGLAYGLRVQYDMEFVELTDLEWSRMALHWFAGGQTFIAGDLLLLGGVGGVGFDMQFHDFPLEVFAEAGAVVGPRGNGAGGVFVGGAGVTGARWYF